MLASTVVRLRSHRAAAMRSVTAPRRAVGVIRSGKTPPYYHNNNNYRMESTTTNTSSGTTVAKESVPTAAATTTTTTSAATATAVASPTKSANRGWWYSAELWGTAGALACWGMAGSASYVYR